MFLAIRRYFRYGNEYDPVDCTVKTYETAEKALKYLRRYQTGLRYVDCQIEDEETGKVIYEHDADYGEHINLIEG